MAWFGGTKAEERIAAALERLCTLYELDLRFRGLNTYTGVDEGEVLLTDGEAIAQKELEDELRRKFGLGVAHDFRVHAPATPGGTSQEEEGQTPQIYPSLFGSSWATLGTGPEGAEGFEPGAAEAWPIEFGPPSAAIGPRYKAQPEGESGPDSSPEPERSSEVNSREPRKKAGE